MRFKEDVRQDAAAPELPYLRRMASAMATLTIWSSSRYRLLKRQLQAIGWDGSASSPRVLVFTEYRETQDALAAALAKDFNLPYRGPFETGNLSSQHMLKNVGKEFKLSYSDQFEAQLLIYN